MMKVALIVAIAIYYPSSAYSQPSKEFGFTLGSGLGYCLNSDCTVAHGRVLSVREDESRITLEIDGVLIGPAPESPRVELTSDMLFSPSNLYGVTQPKERKYQPGDRIAWGVGTKNETFVREGVAVFFTRDLKRIEDLRTTIQLLSGTNLNAAVLSGMALLREPNREVLAGCLMTIALYGKLGKPEFELEILTTLLVNPNVPKNAVVQIGLWIGSRYFLVPEPAKGAALSRIVAALDLGDQAVPGVASALNGILREAPGVGLEIPPSAITKLRKYYSDGHGAPKGNKELEGFLFGEAPK